MAEISASGIADLKKTHKLATVIEPLPAVINQVGSTCGIYALDAALRILGIEAPPPRKGKTPSADLPSPTPASDKKAAASLRKLAREHKLTQIGELFDAADAVTLATLSGAPDAAVVAFDDGEGLLKIVNEAVGKKHSVLFPFCVDNSVKTDSKPKSDGQNPHWCLLIGSYQDPGQQHILATQYGKFYDWSLAELLASNQSLLKWNAQDWGKLEISVHDGVSWKQTFKAWVNKTTPPPSLLSWEERARREPTRCKVEWKKTANFKEINFALTLRGKCVVV